MTNIQDFLTTVAQPGERFLPITNFEGRFWISDIGRIVSFNHKFKFLNPPIDGTGYRSCTLRMKPKKLCIRLHSLVGQHFCEMKDMGVRMTWNHKDGNKLNNHYTNLEYITAAENCTHAVTNGLYDIKGENHPHRKLSNEQVKEIFALKDSGKSFVEIGKIYSISRRQIGDIINGKAWQHITSHHCTT